MRQHSRRKLAVDIADALAVVIMCGVLGGLAGLAFDALLSEGPIRVPFWIRRACTVLFPAYGLGMGLFLGIQDLVVSYANLRVLRQADAHLGPGKRLVDGGESESGSTLELVFQSADAARQVRIARASDDQGVPQAYVQLEQREGAGQGYRELARLPLKYTQLERILSDDARYFRRQLA